MITRPSKRIGARASAGAPRSVLALVLLLLLLAKTAAATGARPVGAATSAVPASDRGGANGNGDGNDDDADDDGDVSRGRDGERRSAVRCRVSVIGGGFGGLYAAFRLQNDSASGYAPNEICVWEKGGRWGGRAMTLADAQGGPVFPMKNRVSLGAHRWNPVEMPLVHSVITSVLGLDSICYSRTHDCDTDPPAYFDLRDSYHGDLSSSEVPGFPYALDPSERWALGSEPPDPEAEILAAYPQLEAYRNQLRSANPGVRYPAFKAVMDEVRSFPVRGMLPHQLAAGIAANHSSEFWALFLTAVGEAPYILQTTNYETVRDAADFMVEDKQGDLLRVIADADGNELGYQRKDDALAELLAASGVRLALNKEVAAVRRRPIDGKLRLRFADGSVAISERVILNVAAPDLLRMSHDSVMFAEASPDLLAMYPLIAPVPAVKAYGYWPRAWWPQLGLDSGEVATDRAPRYYDLRDSAVECAPPDGGGGEPECKGWLNMAYPDDTYWNYFRNPQAAGGGPDPQQVVVHRNSTDPMLSAWFHDFCAQFVQSVCNATNQPAGACDIPEPEIVAMGVWEAAWHTFLPNSRFAGGAINNATLRLAQDVFWANEANSRMQGWAEGSGWAAEQVLHYYFGLHRPSWLGSQAWYENVIENPLL